MSIISETELADPTQDAGADFFRPRTFLLALLLALLVVGAVAYYFTAGRPLNPVNTEYQALSLDNGSTYYGKVVQSTSADLVLRDVYYVQIHTDPKTKQSNNVLVKRGKEWHAPDQMVINRQHLLFVEPVSPGSTVAKLIDDLKKQ